MTRIYSDFNTDLSKAQLDRLADKTTAPEAYQDAIAQLGECLGEAVSSKIPDSDSTLYERLGFDGQEDKNKYVPKLVRTRRRQLVSSQ